MQQQNAHYISYNFYMSYNFPWFNKEIEEKKKNQKSCLIFPKTGKV